jgi:hypothetical protein
MLNGLQFASRDIGGASDPYLVITIGERTINNREKYILDEPNPDFFEFYDFE